MYLVGCETKLWSVLSKSAKFVFAKALRVTEIRIPLQGIRPGSCSLSQKEVTMQCCSQVLTHLVFGSMERSKGFATDDEN